MRKIIILLGLLLVIAAAGWLVFRVTEKQNTSVVNYHVYQPAADSIGPSFPTKTVTGIALAGKKNGIRINYDISYEKFLKGIPPKQIVVQQVGISAGFDLKAFVSSLTKTSGSSRFVALTQTANQTGYLLQKEKEGVKIFTLVYATGDDVLLTISSAKAAPEELIQFAASLE